jgi:hypothetical protein
MNDVAKMEQIFTLLEKAALAGARCVTNDQLPKGGQAAARELARRGKIRIEVSGHNWRTVTILVGPNAGKSTARDPFGHRVYRVIGTEDLIKGRPRMSA